ncbi:MAG: cytochrome c peroxidase [Byssovorax sp.]
MLDHSPRLTAPAALAILLAAGPLLGSCTEDTCARMPGLDAEACRALDEMALPASLPPAAGNAVGDDLGAAKLGFAMFFDARFSQNQMIRCATCHLPERRFQDGRATAKGLAELTRNTPTILNAARLRWAHWDGRADSLWAQALIPLENPKEMGFTRLELAHRVWRSYKDEYEAVFGPLPPLDDEARFPAIGKPGDPAFDGMSAADRETINRIAANAGKAFEAYERKAAAGPSRFDRFLGGDAGALDDAEKRGIVVFFRAGCDGCHGGPTLSDESFHDLGLPTQEGQAPDRGRADGLAYLMANPFNAEGAYWDGARPEPPWPPTADDIGKLHTPSLRNVALSGPYGHDGRFATLKDAVLFHLRGGGRGDPAVVGAVDPSIVPRLVTPAELDDLLALLDAFTGDHPPLPWDDWPDR